MTSRKTIAAEPSAKDTAACHLLHTFLHTVRCIAQQEDALCEFLYEANHTTGLPSALAKELRNLLDQMPSYDYLDDFHALSDILGQPRSTRIARPHKSPKARAGRAVKRRTTRRSTTKPKRPTRREPSR
jgi:hypothetical protein